MNSKISIACLFLPLVPLLANGASEEANIRFSPDLASQEVTGEFQPGSHVKLFIPNLPYLAISHAVNAALVRPANNEQGWQYDLATSHEVIDDKTWEFELRRDVVFQDGSEFDADSVLLNVEYFQQDPFTFSNFAEVLESVEKIGEYKVRFHLNQAHGVFMQDAMWLQFYTQDYLEKFGWNGKPTCPNLAEPGLYALGPYILSEGYLEGDRRSSEVVLKANPNYWGENKAKVETITIYTNLTVAEARDLTLFEEGEIDITFLPFADQAETVLSPFAKLAISPSQNNYALHFNLFNGSEALIDERIRFVINRAIDQEYLLNLSMLGEGVLSPTMVSPHFYKLDEAIASLQDYFQEETSTNNTGLAGLRDMVAEFQRERGLNPSEPLQLSILTQESFRFLVNDIKYFLAQVNIELVINEVASEDLVFDQLLSTGEYNNTVTWDLLIWGNYDWYKHPWSAFFVYQPNSQWSSIPENEELQRFTDRLLQVSTDSEEYAPLIAEFIRHIHQSNYMVFLPTPNNVYALNKEVSFTPGRSAFIYLRDLEVTSHHWSLRGEQLYPQQRMSPTMIQKEVL